MHRFIPAIAVLAVVMSSLAVGACADQETVVTVEGAHGAAISRATLGRWMRSIVGEDLNRRFGTMGPSGLVSEPADYSRCVAAAKLIAARSFFNQLRLDRAQIESLCHELYRSVRQQALRYLIRAQWNIIASVEAGVSVTMTEVKQALARLKETQLSSVHSLQQYLADRQWTMSDLLARLRQGLLSAKLAQRTPLPGDPAAIVERIAQDAPPGIAKLIMRTSCRPGYVVAGCRNARRAPSTPRPPLAILVELTAVAPPSHR